ncbi:hypothetical protein SLS62_008195 [Diatrype stigma]|uniref:F-box domain-containing protein n=1 Tax=Diatrype stigma TaxID=117547 RepID=A0AAN9YL63_9PEZI
MIQNTTTSIMGCWDVYCACCGGPFDHMVRIAAGRGRKRKRPRQRQSESGRGGNAPGLIVAPGSGGASTSEPDPGETVGIGDGTMRGQEEEGGDDKCGYSNEDGEDYEEENDGDGVKDDDLAGYYDRDIVDEDDVAWTRDVYVIGSPADGDDEPIGPAFISGPCGYDLYGGVHLREEAGEDFNFDLYNQCYDVGTDAMHVYPFHKPCLDILAWVLTGAPDRHRLGLGGTLDRLYGALFAHPHISCALALDYGGPQHDQFWTCARGQGEVFVADPLPSLPPKSQKVPKALRDFLALQMPTGSSGNGSGDGTDPFARLPLELLRAVAELLSPRQLAALATASRAVHRALRRDRGFWRAYVRRRMPWFRELHELLGEDGGDDAVDGHTEEERGEKKSLAGLVYWADRETRAWNTDGGTMGHPRPLIGVANRRRIWGVCEQFADSYFARVGASGV